MLYVPTTDAANAMVGVTGCAHRCSIPVARDPARPQDPPIGGTSGRKMAFWADRVYYRFTKVGAVLYLRGPVG